MEYLLPALFYSAPFLMALGLAAGLVVVGGVAWQRPLLPALLYLSVLFIFSSSRYGVLEGSANTIYTRGSGQLFFPLVMWLLLLGVVWMQLGSRLPIRRQAVVLPKVEIQPWLLAWLLLLLCHLFVGALLGQPIAEILDNNGFIQVPVIGLLVALLLFGASGPRALGSLALFVELAALGKAVFGLVRWAAFGGDPANVYANVEKLAVKLTFFEIGDSLVCLLGIAVSVSMLFVNRPQTESTWRRALHWAVLLLGVPCIVLSFRRTAWIGLVAAFGWLLWHLKPRQRALALMFALPVLIAAVTYVAQKRLGAQAAKLGVLSLFYDVVTSRSGAESGRSLELRLAAQEFLSSPIVGNGAWGRYAATTLIPWQDPLRPGNFLHSGLLHLAMKTGIVGLMLLGGVLLAFIKRVRGMVPADAHAQALVAAACMGLLFMLPDFLAGTPTVQFRTMQLIGLCLSLPFFVARAQLARAAD